MTTVERGRQTQDTIILIILQERGGLTPIHWEEVIRKIDSPQGPFTAKIIAYGQKVVAGEFPGKNNHHRMYLGQRHWEQISQINPKDKIKESRIFPPWPKTRSVASEFAEQAKQYANIESRAVYTLDDYIQAIVSEENRETRCRFDFSEGYWIRETIIPRGPTPGGWLPASSHHWPYYDGGTDIITEWATEDEILSLWLLTKEDAPNALCTSPTVLSKRLKETALHNPEEIRERLKSKTPHLARLHDSRFFGILEQEVVN